MNDFARLLLMYKFISQWIYQFRSVPCQTNITLQVQCTVLFMCVTISTRKIELSQSNRRLRGNMKASCVYGRERKQCAHS